MKHDPRVIERFIERSSRFALIERGFSKFIESLQFFADSNAPIKSVTIEKTSDSRYCRASFGSVSIGLRLVYILSPEGSPLGRIVCTIERPSFTSAQRVLGSLEFNPQGLAQFIIEDKPSPGDMETLAPEIVLNFLNSALEQSRVAVDDAVAVSKASRAIR